ncbi:condensation domain-containing protein [Pantanalinema rosaneae CENA516]|uniref:condensation domain-containing protein n=1 Tax=Pantanalinema rosaneae TaxID=1620701 RepID=UPI003D6ECCC4
MQADFRQSSSPTPIGVSDPPPPTLTNFWRMAGNNLRLLHQSPPIQLAPCGQQLPLSFNQERLWHLERLQPHSSVHHLLHSFRLVGNLQVAALERSLAEIARRHAVFRTSFAEVDGQPIQQIAAIVALPLMVIDLRHLSPSEQEQEVQRQAIAQVEQPFDLNHAPLWRVALLQLAETEYVLLRTIHHIIFDGMSHSVFVRELGALYTAFMQDEPSPLLELPVQYTDVAWTQRQWLQGEMLTRQLDYWQQHFQGKVTALELPIDSPRSTATSYQGAFVSQELSAALTEKLQSLSAEAGVSLFVTLMAAFNILLHQYTGQADLVVCSPVSGRYRAETRRLIGYFNNVVALRNDLSGNPRLREVMERVGQCFMEASPYQEVPLQLVAELPNLVRVPLTRAMFVLQNTATPMLELEGLHVSSVFVDREIANFDLSMSIHERQGQLTAVLQYKTDLFRSQTIADMLAQYLQLLDRLTLNPDQRLSDLPVLRTATPHPTYPSEPKLYVAPRNSIEQELVRIWENTLNVAPISVTDNFFELGGHSLLAVQVIAAAEQVLERSCPATNLFRYPTIAQLAEQLQNAAIEALHPSLIPMQVVESSLPLFCVHVLGPNLQFFRPMARHLEQHTLYGLTTALSNGAEVPHPQDIQKLATYYIQVIKTVQPEGPYHVLGVSFGGFIAYEMAQQLVAQGDTVKLLGLLDSYCPVKSRSYRVQRFQRHLHNFRKQGIGYLYERLQQVGERFSHLLIPSSQKPQANHAAIELDAANLQARALIKSEDYEAVNRDYRFVPYPGEITLFRAEDDPDCKLDWQTLAGGRLTIYDVPGDHLGILAEPHVQVLAQKIYAHISAP